MDLYLKAPGDGHVIGFTLPLHPTIERQWRDGVLHRVHEDGSPYGDPFGGLLDGGGVTAVGGGSAPSGPGPSQPVREPAEEPAPASQEAASEEPVRPAANAPKADWAAYAQALGLQVDAKATKADLVALTTPPELDPSRE